MNDSERSEFVEYVAEAMAIYAWTTDVERFLPAAQELLELFQRLYHRDPHDYLEFETWSLSRTQYQKIAKGIAAATMTMRVVSQLND